VLTGLKELRSLGFCHRNIKPENIFVESGRPVKVALGNFEQANPTSNMTSNSVGTFGYRPDKCNWHAGHYMWDLYAFVCTMIECDMPEDGWAKVTGGVAIRGTVKEHVDQRGTCPNIFKIADKTILRYEGCDEPTFEWVEALLKKASFT